MQLNFITGYDYTVLVPPEDPQSSFWDTAFNIIPRLRRNPKYDKIEKFFSELDYSEVSPYIDYWEKITPKTDSEIFRRWLFSFMSVHTGWKTNVIAYTAIKDWWKWLNRWEELLKLVAESGVGLHNNRVKFISEFSHKFWQDPGKYRKTSSESWVEFRDRLEEETLGLGPAKTSFALEMCYPNTAKVTCFDVHMFRMYGLDQTKDSKHYERIEQHWLDMCNMWQVPPYIARSLYWDKTQGYNSSQYWSYVFEQ